MNASEAIAGLGMSVGLNLLDTLHLDRKDDQIAGPEFTYIGLFLSGLGYKDKVDSAADLISSCLTSIEPVHSKLTGSDASIAAGLAESALRSYYTALPSWPSKEVRNHIAIGLCDLLADRLRQFANLDLSVFQKAKLRPKIAEQFEVLEIAYAEMFASNLFEGHQFLNKITKEHEASSAETPNFAARTSLAEIAKAKDKLLVDFDDGEITALEYHRGLDDLIKQEIAIHVEAAESRGQRDGRWNKRNMVFALVAGLLLGLLIGPWLHPKIFGYSNAEECVLSTKHKYAVGACYDLYPSIRK